jgi:hypothetical protein
MCKGGDASENGGACWGEHLTLSTLPQPQAGPSSDLQSANPHTTRVSVSDPLVDGPVAGPVDEKRDRPRIVVEDAIVSLDALVPVVSISRLDQAPAQSLNACVRVRGQG